MQIAGLHAEELSTGVGQDEWSMMECKGKNYQTCVELRIFV